MMLPEETYSALVSSWPVARLATVSADAQPHNVPVVFCGYNGVIYSPLDGKRKKHLRLKRFANLAANPKVALLLDQYTPDWQNLWWVRIDGEADCVEPAAEDAAAVTKQLLEKYPQYSSPSLMFNTVTFLRLRPAKVTAWAQSDSAATIERAVSGFG